MEKKLTLEQYIRQQVQEEFKKLGDPVKDVKLNQQPSGEGADKKNAPTVAVKASGKSKEGQKKAVFSGKTKQAK